MPVENPLDFFRKELARLTSGFHKDLASYKSEGYDESALRNDFLNPFWRSLGWDVENKEGLPQSLREVQIESRVDIAGRKKRADYLFRTGGLERFICEAKKPKEELSKKSAYQAQRYAFNLKLWVATLSNFEALQLFVVGGKPEQNAPWDICKQWHYTEYIQNAEEIWGLFSRVSVASGSLEKYISSLPKRPLKGKARQGWLIAPERIRTVDAEFLAYVEEQRELLAADLVRENKGHKWTAIDLNESIQRILDRILFVRISEDRDIDTGRPLELILADWQSIQAARPSLYSRLVSHFHKLDETFNGALFRRGHESENLTVSDQYLADLIRDLSSEDSPYLFNTLPVEILGSVYERFIGKVVRVTRTGRLTIELKPEVRKAGGVYYTPRYVVNYIVEQTVGRLLEGRKPREVERLKVLDPACGSGSFLIRVFERICEYYIHWYRDHSRYIVALLNSTLFVFLYRLLALEEGRVLAQVKPTLVEDMPIRVIKPQVERERVAHKRLVELAEQLETLHERLSQAKSEHESTTLQRQIDHNMAEVDAIVFELYELSAGEVSLVQGN